MEEKKRISLKDLNRQKVYRYLYQKSKEAAVEAPFPSREDPVEHPKGVSRQQVAYDLHLSLQTATQCLNELLASGKIVEGQMAPSTGGRPALLYLFHKNMRVSIGVEIRSSHFTAAVINLLGELESKQTFSIPFQNQEQYYVQLCEKILTFIRECDLNTDCILGISLSLQAMVNDDTGNISHAMLLQNGRIPITEIRSCLPFPVHLIHDAEAAGMAEAFHRQEKTPAIYLMLDENLGSAFLWNGEVLHSAHLSSGTIEHMKLKPGGRKCYCGKEGCAECYCSADSLKQQSGMELDSFFQKLRVGKEEVSIQWAAYLTDLAALIDNIRMVLPCGVILGGLMESYMQESDLIFLKEKIAELSTYPDIPVQIARGCVRKDAVLQGASMHMLLAYLEEEGL